MLTHCGEETARASSDLAEAVATKLIARGKAGCPMLEAELESALVARDPNFKPHDLPSISHMIKSVAVNTNTDIVSALEQQIRECQAGISADQFQLFLKELDYDKKAIRVHYSNLLNHDKSIKGERNSWKTKVRTDETTASKSFKAKISRTEVWNEDEKMRTSNMIAALKNFKKDLASCLQVDYNLVVSVVLFNGTAPSLTAAGVQLSQIQVLQYLLAESADNICLALTPVFSYKKGQVWLEEHAFVKMLATTGNCAVDTQFSLKFNKKPDIRDARPLVYNGRILTASGQEPSALWTDSKLCAERMAGPVALLAGTDMEMVQYIEPTALPCAHTSTPKGAYRFSQIGVDGWTCCLNTLLDGVNLSARQAILVTDLTGMWTHTFQSFLTLQQSSHAAMFFSIALPVWTTKIGGILKSWRAWC